MGIAATLSMQMLNINDNSLFPVYHLRKYLTSGCHTSAVTKEWNDQLLAWDPAEFNGITKILVPCDKIWLPDIVLYNRYHVLCKQYQILSSITGTMCSVTGTRYCPL